MDALLSKLEKYNPWDSKQMPLGFARTLYLNRFKKYCGNKLVKVFVGQRRVGKSYLMRQLMQFLMNEHGVNPKNIFYLNKEYYVFDSVRDVADLEALFMQYKDTLKPTGKVYVFIDEIQNIQGWEKFVNSYSQDYTSEYELFITGSNSNMLSGELASLLSGRYVEFEVYPFDFTEYCEYTNRMPDKAQFMQYLSLGGLPETYHFNDDEIIRNYVESLKNTIVLRDIISRNSIKDAQLLEELFKYLSSNIGNLTSLSNIIKYFKSRSKQTNYETLSSYISYLHQSFIVHEVERYNIRGKQLLGGDRKYYLNDLAFKTYLMGFYPTDTGAYLENYVYLRLKSLGYKVSVGVLNSSEIDFVAEKDGSTQYFQVAYLLNSESTIAREFGNLRLIPDHFPKTVVSLDDVRFNDPSGILHIKPWEIS